MQAGVVGIDFHGIGNFLFKEYARLKIPMRIIAP
jgi:hypothetical protein